MKIEFEAAELSPLPSAGKQQQRARIGWFLQSIDVNSASARYRCFHFARVLAPRFESLFFTDTAELQSAISSLDAIIAVKRLDRALLEVVASARLTDVPVFLDLCDDLVADRYAKNELGVNLAHFLGVAPMLAGIVVPSAAMSDRLEGYTREHGLTKVSVHVVPDIAETWDIYRATFEWVTGNEAPGKLLVDTQEEYKPLKKVVWFGNYGASHSDFGMFSLRTLRKALKTVHQDIPLELVIISNSELVYRALTKDCGFPTRYVPWSAEGTYAELASADAALLTTGSDEFCSIKSSNRVLQALAMNVPVITPKSTALPEFEDAIFSGKMEQSLRQCLGLMRTRLVRDRLKAAQAVLARYQPERLGYVWAGLLDEAIAASRPVRDRRHAGKLLMLLEAGDSPTVARELFAAARNVPQLDYELLVSTEILAATKEFDELLPTAPAVPRFYSDDLRRRRNLLLGCSALVVERPSAPIAKVLGRFAAQMGVAVMTSDEAAKGRLKEFVRVEEASDTAPTVLQAGPYPERLDRKGKCSWSFIVHESARGWILDAICREIGSRQPSSWQVTYHPQVSPRAKNYFFSHYLLLENYLEKHPEKLKGARVLVWYTHPRAEDPATVAKRLEAFDHVTKVIFACESNRKLWIERGLVEEKTAVVLGAADPELFRFHERGSGIVGLSSSYYERKNPDRLLEVIKLLSHRHFVLLGRKWNQYALFEEMRALPNFEYRTVPYREYPDNYGTFDVFLSISTLEGGPIPLVEAMMSNAVPVASRTGFAPDLIDHGRNGFIFDIDASSVEIAALIEEAFALDTDIRETVVQYDWDRFSAEIVKLAR